MLTSSKSIIQSICVLTIIWSSLASGSSDSGEDDSPGISQEDGYLDYLGDDGQGSNESNDDPDEVDDYSNRQGWSVQSGDAVISGRGYRGTVMGKFPNGEYSIRDSDDGRYYRRGSSTIGVKRGCSGQSRYCYKVRVVSRSGYVGKIVGILEGGERVWVQDDDDSKFYMRSISALAIIGG